MRTTLALFAVNQSVYWLLINHGQLFNILCELVKQHDVRVDHHCCVNHETFVQLDLAQQGEGGRLSEQALDNKVDLCKSEIKNSIPGQ